MRKFLIFFLFVVLLGGVAVMATSPSAKAGENSFTYLPTILNPEIPTAPPTATAISPTAVPPTATPPPPHPGPHVGSLGGL